MDWYKRETKLAGIDLNVRGTRVYLSGDTYRYRSQLNGMGFTWDGQEWHNNLTSVQAPATMDALRNMGVPVENLPGAQPPAPARAPQQAPAPAGPRPSAGAWILARHNRTGTLVAIRRSADKRWQYFQDSGEPLEMGHLAGGGGVSDEEAKSLFTSIRDEAGKPMRGGDPWRLLEEYEAHEASMTNLGEPESEEEAREKDGEDLPDGRIDPERLSDHQRDVQKTFLKSDENIMMDALAGTGKTTMLRHLASFKPPGEKWLYIVFGKRNAKEANQEFPSGVRAMTSHSFVGEVLRNSSDPRGKSLFPTEINMRRHDGLVDEVFKGDRTFPSQLWYPAKSVAKELSELAKHNGVLPTDPGVAKALQGIIRKWNVKTDLSTPQRPSDRDWAPEIIEKTMEILHRSLPGQSGSANPKIDEGRNQDDTLWYGARLDGVNWPRYDVVLADEVQDFNKNQAIMLQKLAERGARIVAVGDPNQAIYMFRGADNDAFENVANVVGGASHQLPTNYRCGKAIIKFVNENTHVDDLRAGPEAPEGYVSNMESNLEQTVGGLESEWGQKTPGMLDMETAIIARTNKPLVDTALNLLRSGVDFQVLGSGDMHKELVKAVKQVTGTGKNERHFPVAELPERMSQKLSEFENDWIAANMPLEQKNDLDEFEGMVETMTHIVDYLRSIKFEDPRVEMSVTTTEDLIGKGWGRNRVKGYFERKFSPINTDTEEGAAEFEKRDPRSFVSLVTAHSSKGLEFDRVFIAEPDLFPHPKTETAEEAAQEANAYYVALTRAKNELHVLIPTPKDEDKELEAAQEWIHGNVPGLKKESKRALEGWITQNCRLSVRN